MEQNNTVPVKFSLSGSKKRARLHVPLKISQLRKQVRSSFSNVKEFELLYVDEEGDNIIVNTDEDLVEAQSVFKMLGRVISFIVDTSSAPERTEQSRAPVADSSSRNSPLRPTVNSSNKSQKGKFECNRKPCPKPCDANCHFTCDFSHLGQMASKIFEHPECLANTMRSLFIGPATACTGASTSPTEGDVVELHSLSATDFNGRRGRCGCFDRTTGRHQVVLFATKTSPGQTIAVRTRNMKTVRSCSPKNSQHEQLPTKTPFGPGSFGPDVVVLQKALIKLGYMHPSAIRHLQGFYGPRTTTAVAKIAKAIGCTGGGAFTDRVRAHLLHRLASLEHCNSTPTNRVSVPITFLRKVSTLLPKEKSVTEPTTNYPPSVAVTVPTKKSVIVPTTSSPPSVAVTEPTTNLPPSVAVSEPMTNSPPSVAVSESTTNSPPSVAVTVPTTNSPPSVAVSEPTTNSPPSVAVSEPTTNSPPSVAVSVPTKKSVTEPTTNTPPSVAMTVSTTNSPPSVAVTEPTTNLPPSVAVTVPTTNSPPSVAVTEPTTNSPPSVAVSEPTTNSPPSVAVTVPTTNTTNTPPSVAMTVSTKKSVTEPTTNSPPSVAVTVSTKKSVIVPTTNTPAPPATVTVPTSKVRQLLDMGFALPVETLTNVLSAANDDVGAALTALLGRE